MKMIMIMMIDDDDGGYCYHCYYCCRHHHHHHFCYHYYHYYYYYHYYHYYYHCCCCCYYHYYFHYYNHYYSRDYNPAVLSFASNYYNLFKDRTPVDLIRPVSQIRAPPGPRLNIKTVLSAYGDFHVKDKTAVRTSYL